MKRKRQNKYLKKSNKMKIFLYAPHTSIIQRNVNMCKRRKFIFVLLETIENQISKKKKRKKKNQRKKKLNIFKSPFGCVVFLFSCLFWNEFTVN